MSDIEFNENDFLFGLEFEFYFKNIDQKKIFIKSLNEKFDTDVLDLTHTKYAENDEKWIISVEETMPELTEKRFGIELTTPILEYNQVEETIDFVLELIKTHGFTNDSCGFHFHLSTDNENFNYPDIIKFLLLLDHNGVFSDYHIRNNYALNILDVLKTTNLEIFRQWYKCLHKYYNIYFVDLDQKHIEIRIIGSENYEYDETIFEFIENILYYFYLSLTEKEKEKYAIILETFNKFNKNKTLLYKDDLEKLAEEHAVSFEEKYRHCKKTRIMNLERRLSK